MVKKSNLSYFECSIVGVPTQSGLRQPSLGFTENGQYFVPNCFPDGVEAREE